MPRKAKKVKEKAIAAKQPSQPFILTKEKFDSDLSNLCYEAWTHRGSEHHLYPLYNHILSVNCSTLRHRNAPRVSIAPCPQPLFGPLPPAVPLGDTAPPKPSNKKTLPSQFPDFARMLIYSDSIPLPDGSHPVRHIIDAWELKTLNSGCLWWSAESRVSAQRKLRTFLGQCQDQAEAGFAHNPDWTRIYTLLVVGPYFTQLVWRDRPPEVTLTSVEVPEVPDASDPAEVEPKGDYREPIAQLLKAIKRCEKRKLPEVLCFNAPVFTYHLGDPDSESYQPVSLSPEFLWALAEPLMHHFPDIPVEPTSWFYPETTTRPPVALGDITLAKDHVRKAVKDEKIDKLKQSARSLGHVFPGDKRPAVTPSPPVSKLDDSGKFPTRKRNVPDVPPLTTRASAKARAAETADGHQPQGDEADAADLGMLPDIEEGTEGEISGESAGMS